jgi:phage-related protein
METFLWPPTSVRLKEKPKVLSAGYGDGYTQRVADGMRPILQEWTVRFDGCEPSIAAQIRAFLRARGGVEAFYFQTKLDETVKVICEEWEIGDADQRQVDVTLTFKEVMA